MFLKHLDEAFVPKWISRSLWIGLLVSIFAMGFVYLSGPFSLGVPVSVQGAVGPLLLRLDELTVLMLTMVALLFACIARYSRSYLAGEPGYASFFWRLLLLSIVTSLFILSQNLVFMLVCWVLMSLSLHPLLLFYPDRARARIAASKKFFVSRLGDLFLLVAFGLIYRSFGTLDLMELIDLVQAMSRQEYRDSTLPVVSSLIAAGALIKSAQFPFHFWLPESMETPTPVSAVMHAGIINAGGFLLIRLSPLMVHATEVHAFIAITGTVSAVFGALVMMTQNDIKKKLAYSTISQMGLMIFACGLGAFSVAVVHIIAHSFYKAHGFLSTGSLVEESRKTSWGSGHRSLAWAVVPPIFCGLIIVLAGVYVRDQLSLFAYAAVILLGLFESSILSSSRKSRGLTSTLIASMILISLAAAVGIEVGAHQVLGHLASSRWLDGAPQVALVWVCYLFFSSGFLLAWALRKRATSWIEKIYICLWNGGYFSLLTTRAFGYLGAVPSGSEIISIGKEA